MRLAAACLLAVLAAATAAAQAQVRKLEPVDEGAADPSWQQFRNRLMAALERKDAKVVLGTLDPKVRNGDGRLGGGGRTVHRGGSCRRRRNRATFAGDDAWSVDAGSRRVTASQLRHMFTVVVRSGAAALGSVRELEIQVLAAVKVAETRPVYVVQRRVRVVRGLGAGLGEQHLATEFFRCANTSSHQCALAAAVA